MSQILQRKHQGPDKSVTKETSVRAAEPSEEPSGIPMDGWIAPLMLRGCPTLSNTVQHCPTLSNTVLATLSNRLPVLLCNAPLSDGAKVYFRSVIRFNPAAHFSRAYGCPWWLTVATEGVLRGRLGGRQCQHASHSLVTLRVTMSATGHWIHTSVTACTWSRVLDIRRSYKGGLSIDFALEGKKKPFCTLNT